jgi:phosphatidylserine/phosphatidylglycerophosphate/cardiolipin synthase-like enzyme
MTSVPPVFSAPEARARLVVTLPFRPSELEAALGSVAPDGAPALTDTFEAFNHLARRSKQRLVVLTPFIDASGLGWATRLFQASQADQKILILRDRLKLQAYPQEAAILMPLLSELLEYRVMHQGIDRALPIETFHAKIVMADSSAAYVGSANMLQSSLELALECGFIIEGPAVRQVADVVDAILMVARSQSVARPSW